MRKLFVFLCMFFPYHTLSAQQQGWEVLINTLMNEENEGSEEWEDIFHVLSDMAEHPIDINKATREDLERIPFLTDQQVEELCAYLYQYDGMRSLGELTMIESLDATRRQLLTYFTYIDDRQQEKKFPKLKDIGKHGKHNLTVTGKIPFYERKGDQNGYLGYPYRHSLRYTFNYGDYMQAGLIGAQDAGEPFFADQNRWGYDHYSFYLVIRKLGKLKALAVGRYKLKFGMGLVINNDFNFGKAASLSALGRSSNTIRPYTSRSAANYLQGAAATVTLAKDLDLTTFISHRKIDATLNSDQASIATILNDGYHRTPTEMKKKHNASETCGGGNLHYFNKGFHFGITGIYTTFDMSLQPKTNQSFRQYYPAGKHFWNTGIDYGYTSRRFSASGETATGDSHAFATINRISFQPVEILQLLLLQRYYAYKYYALYGQSFNAGGSVQNENGIYLGTVWKPLRHLNITAYIDYAYFKWEKYQAAAPSQAWESLISITYTRKNNTLAARYQFKLREKDNRQKTRLVNDFTQRGRLSFTCQTSIWSLKTQADCAWNRYKKDSFGWMVNECVTWQRKNNKLQATATVGYFHTDDYQSCIYTYEQGPLYQFTFPAYYGHGIHYSLFIRVNLSPPLMLIGKVSTTDYFDRDHISSGLQQIDGSAMTEAELQVRWSF